VCLASALALALLATAFNTARAGSVTLAWRPSPSYGVVSYKIYYGTSSGSYQAALVVPNATIAQIDGLVEGTTYYFVASTVTATGEESQVSNEAQFTVPANQSANSPSSASGLANISTRADVLTGESATIGGFVIAGTENHTVLVRGLGPTLSSFGINGVLPNPFLTLHYADLLGSETVVATNDNWKDTQQDAIRATGLAPSDDSEAAIIQSLALGTYTAILTDADGGSGARPD
jgi:fibronectin type III domain protein